MKKLNLSFNSNRPARKLTTCLAVTATAAMLTLAGAVWVNRANAGPFSGPEKNVLQEVVDLVQNSQVAELDQLAANFHGALSYGGNITAMMSLWADHCSLTFNNGTPYVGKAAVQSFFLSGGYFLNNWVSLAPEYKTQITIHGNTAVISTQCVAIDLNASPMVVKSVIQVSATCERIQGKWLFTSMNNTTPAPL
jgi:hypothetical protein